MLDKGVIQKVVPTQDQYLSNLFLVEKSYGGNCPLINFLNKFLKPQQIYSLWAFPNSRSALSEILSSTGPFAMQDRSEGSVFFSFPQQKLTKVCEISMVRQPIRIHLPMFWIWASSTNFCKIIKSPKYPLRRVSI